MIVETGREQEIHADLVSFPTCRCVRAAIWLCSHDVWSHQEFCTRGLPCDVSLSGDGEGGGVLFSNGKSVVCDVQSGCLRLALEGVALVCTGPAAPAPFQV